MRMRGGKASKARVRANTARGPIESVPVADHEWKDADPPFMRAVYDRDAPYVWTTGRVHRTMTVGEVKASRKRSAEHRRQVWDRRRARKMGAAIGAVDRAEIIERDASTCYLCGKVCEEKEIHLDHIIPLSRGGSHSADNVGVACGYCNLRKHDTLTDKRPSALSGTLPVGLAEEA